MIKECDQNHVGAEPIIVGPHQVYATGMKYIWRGAVDLSQFEVLVPLDHHFSGDEVYDEQEVIWEAVIPDFQPPGPGFSDLLREKVIPALATNQKVLIFCTASHGRTGTVIAGLIALLEPGVDDPIEAVRKRHCGKSVETREQALWVRNLREQVLSERITEVMADADPC
jgi:protein-tyrosine phosphatase